MHIDRIKDAWKPYTENSCPLLLKEQLKKYRNYVQLRISNGNSETYTDRLNKKAYKVFKEIHEQLGPEVGFLFAIAISPNRIVRTALKEDFKSCLREWWNEVSHPPSLTSVAVNVYQTHFRNICEDVNAVDLIETKLGQEDCINGEDDTESRPKNVKIDLIKRVKSTRSKFKSFTH